MANRGNNRKDGNKKGGIAMNENDIKIWKERDKDDAGKKVKKFGMNCIKLGGK